MEKKIKKLNFNIKVYFYFDSLVKKSRVINNS